MRKPKLTKKQKQHAREQRALMRLRKAAVRYTLVMERVRSVEGPMAFAELGAACDAYTNALTVREQRKLSGLWKPREEELELELDQEQLELVPIAGTVANESTREVELHLSDGRVLVIPDMPTRKQGNS